MLFRSSDTTRMKVLLFFHCSKVLYLFQIPGNVCLVAAVAPAGALPPVALLANIQGEVLFIEKSLLVLDKLVRNLSLATLTVVLPCLFLIFSLIERKFSLSESLQICTKVDGSETVYVSSCDAARTACVRTCATHAIACDQPPYVNPKLMCRFTTPNRSHTQRIAVGSDRSY